MRRLVLVLAALLLGLATALGSGNLSGQAGPRPWAPEDSLAAAARQGGLVYGAAVGQQALEDRAFRRLLIDQVGSVTPENSLKWEVVEPHRGRFDFRQGDALLRLARGHGLQMRGHTLVWHRQEPAWLEAIPPGDLGPVLRSHIQGLMGHYRGQVRYWDVINEPLADDGSGLRRTRWWQALGPDYIAQALEWAHRSDPGARLVINEYGLEGETPAARGKRQALLTLLQDLRRQHAPLDAIGLQAHLRAGPGRGRFEGLGPFLEQLQDLGLEIQITELDVDDRLLPGDPLLRDRQVAHIYTRFLAVVLRNPAVRQVTTWGLSDRYSWLNSEAPRLDGLAQRGLAFDTTLKAKPLAAVMGRQFVRAASGTEAGRNRVAAEQ